MHHCQVFSYRTWFWPNPTSLRQQICQSDSQIKVRCENIVASHHYRDNNDETSGDWFGGSVLYDVLSSGVELKSCEPNAERKPETHHFDYPRWMFISCREASESRNTLEMCLVLSLQLPMAIGGLLIDFQKSVQQSIIYMTNINEFCTGQSGQVANPINPKSEDWFAARCPMEWHRVLWTNSQHYIFILQNIFFGTRVQVHGIMDRPKIKIRVPCTWGAEKYFSQKINYFLWTQSAALPIKRTERKER